MADERVNRKDGESRVCKGESEGGGREGEEIYEFAVTAMALAYSPRFSRLYTTTNGKIEIDVKTIYSHNRRCVNCNVYTIVEKNP